MNSSVTVNLYLDPTFNRRAPKAQLGPVGPVSPIVVLPPPTSGPPAGAFSVVNPTNGYLALSTLPELRDLTLLPDAVLGLRASHTWGGFPVASALGWVKWGDGNTTGKFRKPLIFVEGIDFGCADIERCSIYTPNQTGLITSQILAEAAKYGSYRNGTAGWNEMVAYNDDFPAVEKLPQLRAQLTALGYDLIYLDFSDGATYIQSNAMTLVELLDYINQPANRAAGAEETIVTAASMGGQVARFALAWMEQQGLCHNSKIYLSIDSPHRGANIPLGVQYMISRLRKVWPGGSTFGLQRDKLLRPASQQMLVYHFDPGAATLRNQWQTWQASPGSYPSLLRKIAIADGNRLGQALPGAFPGMDLLGTSGFGGFVWHANSSYSLPGASVRGNNNVIYRYKNPYSTRWHYTQVDNSYATYDQAPGGTRTTTSDAEKDGHGFLKAGSEYQTFIPIISALDVAAAGSIYQPNLYYNVENNIKDPKRPDPGKYAFEAYYAPDGISEPHINITNGLPSQHSNPTYTSNNTAWILNELRESAHNLPALLTGTYNYGSLYRRLLPSVEVAAGGQLFINNAGLPNSGGVNTANDPKESSFEVYTSSCGSRVQLDQGGRLTLGQPNDAHVATLRIANNSLLDLRAGGQTTVNAGSVLRVQRGGTLVVRRGAVLSISGQVIVEEGANICVADPASLVLAGGGSYTVSPAANYGVPASLDLGTLECQPSGQAPLSISFSTFNYVDWCLSNSGRPNYGRWTAVASGGTGTYGYEWYVDFGGTGNNFQRQFSSSSANFGICLGANNGNVVLVKVVVTSGASQASAIYYGQPQYRLALFPNPADSFVDVANADDVPVTGTSARLAAPSEPAQPMQVLVHNGQGKKVFAADEVKTDALHLPTATWPAGLYQVTIRQGKTVVRHQLSVQH